MDRSPALSEQVNVWRADTPGCAHRIHLNNAGASLMPAPVVRRIAEHLRLESEIGGYEASDRVAEEGERCYDAIAELVGATPRNIAITSSATTAFVQAMSAFDFAPGDVIVATRADYTSYQIQFQSLAARLGVEVLHAADLPEGGADPQSVRELAQHPRCRLVHASWVPTHSGLVQDVAAIGAVCEELGVPYFVDACQAAGQIPIDVAELRCDYLSATGRKFLRGPRGIGFLYVSDRALERGDHPLFVDMRGATWEAPKRYRLVDSAKRFEDWEFPYAVVLGLGEAVRYALGVRVERGGARARELAARIRRSLAELPGVRVLSAGANPCAIVTAAIEGRNAPELVNALRERGVNTSATLRWYGLLDFEKTDVTSALRLSPHYYNTEAEVDDAIGILAELVAREPRVAHA